MLKKRRRKAAMGASIAVVPLTIPLLTGPATMSTVVIYADKAKTFWQLATLVGYGVVIALATALCFALAQPIARRWSGQNRHQRDDPADGPDSGRAGGGGDVRRAGQAVSGQEIGEPANAKILSELVQLFGSLAKK
jgi:hypothetical protein